MRAVEQEFLNFCSDCNVASSDYQSVT